MIGLDHVGRVVVNEGGVGRNGVFHRVPVGSEFDGVIGDGCARRDLPALWPIFRPRRRRQTRCCDPMDFFGPCAGRA